MGGENAQQDCQSAASNDKDQARLLNDVKKKFESMRTSDPMEALSPNVRKRVEVLKEIQSQYDSFEEKFFEERAALEAKYQKLYEPLYTKRSEIVNGVIEVDGVSNEVTEETTADENPTEEKGVPNFWFTAMKSNEILAEEIQERDEDALKYLNDIKWCRTDDPKGFKLEFYFGTNPYFKNSILTKLYHMIDDNEPILEKAIGTKIEWYPGKNLAQKVLKKKSKNTRIMTKTQKCESFFNFFSPPEVPENEEDLDDDAADQLQNELEEDYDIGSTIRDKIIPHAVSWYTGEAAEDDGLEDLGVEEEDEDEDDDEDEEDEEDEDDAEEDRITQKKSGSRKMKGQPGDQPAECKQQ